MGVLYEKLGQYDLALEYLRRSLCLLLNSTHYPSRLSFADLYNCIESVHLKQNELGEALQNY
jgi:tetratricopeptide (TPR) repeat protein